MAGLERVVVGYREHDRRRHQLVDRYGLHSVAVRRCVAGCGYPVYFVASGIAAAKSRDAEVICDQCFQENRNHVVAAL